MSDWIGYYASIGGLLARNRPTPCHDILQLLNIFRKTHGIL